jgi:hypothetical protein
VTDRQENPVVIAAEFWDWHDQQYMQEEIQKLAADGGAHVYFHEPSASYVISHRALSGRQVERAVVEDHKEQARDMLKAGDTLEDIWALLYISGRSISQIAKQEGIKLPYGWFTKLTDQVDDVCKECRDKEKEPVCN